MLGSTIAAHSKYLNQVAALRYEFDVVEMITVGAHTSLPCGEYRVTQCSCLAYTLEPRAPLLNNDLHHMNR